MKIRDLPWIGGLTINAHKRDFIEALKETSVIVLFSLVPIVFAVIVETCLTKQLDVPNWLSVIINSAKSNLNKGEIFLYAISLFAPVVFVIYKYNRRATGTFFNNSITFHS
jgi:hypothetical protein